MGYCVESLKKLEEECLKCIKLVQAAKNDIFTLRSYFSRMEFIDDGIVSDENDGSDAKIKHIQDEDWFLSNNPQMRNNQYTLLNFLFGKGGSSEIYNAYELVKYRHGRCNVLGSNSQWTKEEKYSTRHAIREYNIHKSLMYHHIVGLWGIFQADQKSFYTVLGYCCGNYVNIVFKITPTLTDREARIRPQKIFHNDVKAGSVLFPEVGTATMTDFPLSKAKFPSRPEPKPPDIVAL